MRGERARVPGTRPRLRRRWAVAAAVLLVVQLISFYVPGSGEPPDPRFPHLDKVFHGLSFAAVAFCALRARLPLGPVFVILLVHAGASEVIQGLWVPRRSGDVWDLAADTAGILVGTAAAGALPIRRRTPPER